MVVGQQQQQQQYSDRESAHGLRKGGGEWREVVNKENQIRRYDPVDKSVLDNELGRLWTR